MDFEVQQFEQEAEGDDVQNFFEEGIEDNQYNMYKDAVFFVLDLSIDVTEIKDHSQKQTQLNQLLNSFQHFLQMKIISSPSDRIGFAVYNTTETNNELKLKHITILQDLEELNAKMIKNVYKYEEMIKSQIGNCQSDLHEVFWLCQNELNQLDKNRFNKRIFLFTDNDNPNSSGTEADMTLRKQAIQRGKTLEELNIQIEIFPMFNKQFAFQKFYAQFIYFDNDEVNLATTDTSSKIAELNLRLKQKEFKKRTLNRLNFDIGLDQDGNPLQVGIKVFCKFNKAKKPFSIPLDGKTNKKIKKQTKIICQDTGENLVEEQIGTFMPLSGEKVLMSKEEMKQLKSVQEPGLSLLGFEDKSFLKPHYNIKASYFLYPDQERIKGSSEFFNALIDVLIDQKQIAIGRIMPREGTMPRFVALIPQQESYDQNHFQTPPGFNMVFLPYADDIRACKFVKEKKQAELTRDIQNAAKLFVNSLELIDFDLRNFEDPTIQKFYQHLQAHALNEQEIEEVEDLLQPDMEGQLKNQDVISLFQLAINNEINFDEEVKQDEKPKKVIKPKVQKQEEKSNKKPRGKQQQKQVEESNQQQQTINEEEKLILSDKDKEKIKSIEDKILDGDFSLNVKDLRFYLESNQQPINGNKQDLIDRILDYIAQA